MKNLILGFVFLSFISCSSKENKTSTKNIASNISVDSTHKNTDTGSKEEFVINDGNLLYGFKIKRLLKSKVLDSVRVGNITNIFPTDSGFVFTASIWKQRNASNSYRTFGFGLLNKDFKLLTIKNTDLFTPDAILFKNDSLFFLKNEGSNSQLLCYNSKLDSLFTFTFQNTDYIETESDEENKLIKYKEKLVLIRTNPFNFKIKSIDLKEKKVELDYTADKRNQSFESTIKNSSDIVFVNRIVKNSNIYPNLYSLDSEIKIKSSITLENDSLFHVNDAWKYNDSLIIMAGYRSEHRKIFYYSRAAIIITKTNGHVLKRIKIPNENLELTGECLSIVPYKNDFLILIQDGIDSEGRLLLARLSSTTLSIDMLCELFRTSGRHSNSILVTNDEAIIYGGEFERSADIPQFDHPILIKIKIKD